MPQQRGLAESRDGRVLLVRAKCTGGREVNPTRKPRSPMRTAQEEPEKKKMDDKMTGKERQLRDRTDQQLVTEQCPQQAGTNEQEDWLQQSDVARISTPTS